MKTTFKPQTEVLSVISRFKLKRAAKSYRSQVKWGLRIA